ncbi:hypothetical protein KC722_00780 [Candidatus Kaiserbacteria bacterium]|nr:hypothetical protein [Candidatus Kaiserbacteria bacterium]MCB9811492.1 hypothetical protein [Candidatus Nomurabacteria bacterium]
MERHHYDDPDETIWEEIANTATVLWAVCVVGLELLAKWGAKKLEANVWGKRLAARRAEKKNESGT